MITLDQDGLPKYIVNFDELTAYLKDELLQLLDDALGDQYPEINTNDLVTSINGLKDLLPKEYYQDLKFKIDQFVYKKVTGIQKIEGVRLDVPPLVQKNKHDFIFENDVYLTGFHLHQTAWKKDDKYNLIVKKNHIINSAYTKEIGEHKYFNTFFKVNANTPISFILENNSGNSRETMIDLEYIEGSEISIEPPPPPPPVNSDEYWVDQIENNWDLVVVMNWEQSAVDVDLHGYIGDDHIYYGEKSKSGVHLNFDYTSHEIDTFPEILSIDGNHGKKLEVFIHNYTGGELQEPVSVKVYEKGVNGKQRLIKEYNIKLAASSAKQIGVCVIDITTHKVTDLKNVTK